MAGNYEKMLDYYPLLIESAIDFKIESRKILAQHNSKYFNSHFIELISNVSKMLYVCSELYRRWTTDL